MSSSHRPLVSAADLAVELAGSAPPVVLDVRWTLAGPQRSEYQAGHIPGAVFVDLGAELADAPRLSGDDGGRHPLPEPLDLQTVLRAAGISADSQVVVYDEANSAAAARAWWLVRWASHPTVRVLDGGFAGWSRAELAVDEGAPAPPTPGDIVVSDGGMPTVDIDGAAAAGSASESVLLDARAVERYLGETEPIDPVAGHIPGAVSLPLTDLVTVDGTFRSPAEIAERFAIAGVVSGVPAVASCGSGVTACHVILAGEIAGLSLSLFPGSYSGWCAAGRPVAVGAKA